MIVSYIRTSTQLQQNSIDTQIDTIEKYCDYKGNVNSISNPNGALENIAGIFNSKKIY